MTFITGLALRRSSVTILVILLVLAAGVITYWNLQRELFPEIEFPNITIVTVFSSADPETVEREVTEPIEEVIDRIDGLKDLQSTSSENLSLVLATFEFGEDMEDAKRTIESNINGIDFPDGVKDPVVSRINSNTFPVMQLSVISDRDIPSLQRVLDDVLIPQIERVGGVFRVDVVGKVDEQIIVTVDTYKLEDLGLTMVMVSTAIRDNNISFPAGTIDQAGSTFAVRATHELGGLEDIRNLTVGFENAPGSGAPLVGSRRGQRRVLVRDVAEVRLGTAEASAISRTNSKPSLNIVVIKQADGNTVEVTTDILESLDSLSGLPPDIEILVLTNDGPEVEEQLSGLLREGLLGFLFAILAVFVFLINTRPSLLKGVALTLRPTAIIGVSIPLSILGGILIMGLSGISLNFMSLAGLAIAVGRVVDDSIVVLENMYRHIQQDENRMEVALLATREVGAAIVSSTATTVVVFIPLAFIQGLVGEFFQPFALAVSFALIASTVVALTAVPVLGALLLRPGDIPDQAEAGGGQSVSRDTWLQRCYSPVLLWSLRHKVIAILVSLIVTGSSVFLVLVIPITLFPAGTPQFLTMKVELPTSSSVGLTFDEVLRVEEVMEEFRERGLVEIYQVSLGGSGNEIGSAAGSAGLNIASFIAKLPEDVPLDIADQIRARLPEREGVEVTVEEISSGPPADALEITVTGANFTAVVDAAQRLVIELEGIEGVINLNSDVSDAREELTVHIDPRAAGEVGLTASAVGAQVNQFIVGRAVTEVDIEGVTMDVVVRGQPDQVENIDQIKNLQIAGPLGHVRLGSIGEIAIEDGPVTISRFDLERSASLTGLIVGEDTQAIGQKVAAVIDFLELPPGVEVKTGGIFEQIAEGFQDVGLAMAVGIVLVFLVMIATLGSIRNAVIIILSLPLAVVGALLALAITDRTLSLSALMGFLLLIGVVVTNAIVLITFVEQLRERGLAVYDALVEGGRTRVRPILMTAFTTTFALFPLAVASGSEGGIIGAELATVVIGGLVSSTLLTLIVVPVLYTIFHSSLPNLLRRLGIGGGRSVAANQALSSVQVQADG